jgi:hypothetical protein
MEQEAAALAWDDPKVDAMNRKHAMALRALDASRPRGNEPENDAWIEELRRADAEFELEWDLIYEPVYRRILHELCVKAAQAVTEASEDTRNVFLSSSTTK